MLHTFTLAVSKEWAPRWQGCRCPCSSIHPQLRGLSPQKLQRRVLSHNSHSASTNNVATYIYVYIQYVWFYFGQWAGIDHLEAQKKKWCTIDKMKQHSQVENIMVVHNVTQINSGIKSKCKQKIIIPSKYQTSDFTTKLINNIYLLQGLTLVIHHGIKLFMFSDKRFVYICSACKHMSIFSRVETKDYFYYRLLLIIFLIIKKCQ